MKFVHIALFRHFAQNTSCVVQITPILRPCTTIENSTISAIVASDLIMFLPLLFYLIVYHGLDIMQYTESKMHRKQCMRDHRLRIQTLYFDAGFKEGQIALQLCLTRDQIRYAPSHRPASQKHTRGRKIFLHMPQQKRLIEWVIASRAIRYT